MKKLLVKIFIVFSMALLFGLLPNSNVQAATVGQQLTVPESGYQRINNTDPNLTYHGSWKLSSELPEYGMYNNDDTISKNTNDSITFDFTGNKLIIGAYCNWDNSGINVNIDGSNLGNFRCTEYAAPNTVGGKSVVIFEKTGLSNREHYVKLTVLDKDTYKESSVTRFCLDYIDIDSTGKLKPYDGNTTNVSNITLNKSTDALQVGQTDTLTATVTPDNATNKNVAWKSSDESIATVDQTGKVTAVKEGTATITATTTDGSNLSASCVVTVTPQGTTPTNPTDNTGNAILTITMTNGNVKSYTVSMSKVNDFISWYNNRSAGSNGSPYYTFDKTDNLQPFSKKTEYVVFDKISSFEVDEYTKQ